MKAFYENRIYSSQIPVIVRPVKNMEFVAHWHNDIEIIYVFEGRLGVGINSEYRVLREGELSVCGSNDIHYYNSEGTTSNTMIIIFRPELLTEFKYWSEKLQPCSLFMHSNSSCDAAEYEQAQQSLRNFYYGLIEEVRRQEPLFPTLAAIRVVELFLLLFRHFPGYYEACKRASAGPRVSGDIKPMQKALDYLEENYTQEIRLEQIAEEVNLSRFYFSRLFHRTTGMSFNAYLTRIRVDRAESLIKSTRRPIIEIAYEAGFNSIRTFNRAFREIKDCTPQSLRKYM